MDQITIDDILEKHKKFINMALENHIEFAYIKSCMNKIVSRGFVPFYYDFAMDSYNSYVRMPDNGVHESIYWSLQDVTIKMYDDLREYNEKRNEFNNLRY